MSTDIGGIILLQALKYSESNLSHSSTNPTWLAWHWVWDSAVTAVTTCLSHGTACSNVNQNVCVFSEYNLQLCVTVSQGRHPRCMNKLCTHSVHHYLHEVPSYLYCCYVWQEAGVHKQLYWQWKEHEGTITITEPENTKTVPLQIANVRNAMKHQK
jgi:hypothetical protein